MQHINLYHNKLKKRVLLFSSLRLMQASIALIIALGLIHAINEYRYYSTQAQINSSAKLLTEKTQRLTKFQASLPKIQKDFSLKVKLQQLEKDLINKQTVLEVLSNKKLGNTTGFAHHFEGLARQSIQGLWITRAHFLQGGTVLDIQGKSNHPDLVPKYLQALSAENAFKGSEFNSFIIQKNPKSNILEFKLNNITAENSKAELTRR